MSKLMNRFVIALSVCAVVLSTASWSEAVTIKSVYSIEDSDVRNDNSGGPGNPAGINNRSDFLEVRNLTSTTGGATRKRVAYVKFDISDIGPAAYDSVTISFTMPDNRNSAGVMSVYGLIDGVVNANDPNFSEANWYSYHDAAGNPASNNGTVIPTPPADGLTWRKGLGIDEPMVAQTDGTGALGINPAEATLLGVINIPGGQADITSNSVDLPLGNFLNADTNGVVTFILTGTPEWRIRARENATQSNLSTRLNYIPEPGSLSLMAICGLLGMGIRRR